MNYEMYRKESIKQINNNINNLLKIYYSPSQNKKIILENLLIETNKLKTLENIKNKKSIVDKLNYFSYLDSNNKNYKFNIEKLFELLKSTILHNCNIKLFSNTYLTDCNKKVNRTDILTNICQLNNLDLYTNLSSNLEKKEIFIRNTNRNDKKFKSFISNNIPTRSINTEQGDLIYYYGGKNKDVILEELDFIYECTMEYGVSFSKENYKKLKQKVKTTKKCN